jgi:prepilin-type N-terminal cleavage/methylation domain-containing protein
MPRAVERRAAFTLIEMIAVVLLFSLLVAMIAPNFGRLSDAALRAAADDLAARLELARQRSVMTGIPHRVWIDLDAAAYRVEWLASEAEQTGEAAAPEPEPLDLRGDGPLPLSAPRDAERAFRPLPGSLGRDSLLARDLAFRGVETAEGWVERGQAAIEFETDGTADWTSVVIDDDAGRGLAIDVLPLAEAVRVRDAES